MKKLTRREMLKGISIGLAGAVFAVPGALKAAEEKKSEDKKVNTPVIARLFYDVYSEIEHKTADESLHAAGRLTESKTKEWDWVIPAPAKGWKIMPSSLKITKNVTGDSIGDESTYVSEPIFQNDGSVKIHLRIKVKRNGKATLFVTAKYDIVTDGEFDLKTDSVEFEDNKVTLKLPEDKNDRTVRSSFVQVTFIDGKKEKINLSNMDDDYLVQNGLVLKISQDKKTIYIKQHK